MTAAQDYPRRKTSFLNQTGPFLYFAFGLSVESDWPLPCHTTPQESFANVSLEAGSWDFFALRVPEEWRQPTRRPSFHHLADGSHYLRWRDQFEFHFSADGHTITALSLDSNPESAFRTYMLGHVLAHALLAMGIETIHAANVERDGHAIAVMGDSAFGKSTLTAALLKSGFRLLSDDFMVLRRQETDFFVYPGLPRIKLYEKVAQLAPMGQPGTPMFAHRRPKMVYPVCDAVQTPVPLRAFYALASPKVSANAKGVRIEPLAEREAYLELMKNSFNVTVTRSERLTSQFHWATELAKELPIKRLYYPRVMSVLPEVIEAIKADLYASGLQTTRRNLIG